MRTAAHFGHGGDSRYQAGGPSGTLTLTLTLTLALALALALTLTLTLTLP